MDRVLRCLTSDDDGGGSSRSFTQAAVFATVLRLALLDDQLQRGSVLLHLVFVTTVQGFVSFQPVYRVVRFGKVTAQGHLIALLHLNVFQFLGKFNGSFWGEEEKQLTIFFNKLKDKIQYYFLFLYLYVITLSIQNYYFGKFF